MNEHIASLQRQLIEIEANLRLIGERKSQYVQETDIPLQVIRDERRLQSERERISAELSRLEATSERDSSSQTAYRPRDETPPEPPTGIGRYLREHPVVTVGIIGLIGIVLAALIGILPEMIRTKDPAPTLAMQVSSDRAAFTATTLPPTPTAEDPALIATPLGTSRAESLGAVPQIIAITETPTDPPSPAFTTTLRTNDTRIPTPTLPSTSTPIPSATPLPPTNIPLPPLSFQTVSISQVANGSTEEGYASPPQGTVELGGVPFYLPAGANSITTQAEPLPGNPTRIQLDANLPDPQQVHMLITGGNVFSRFAGQPFGEIQLRFANSALVSVPLIAGQNIREWKLLDEQTISTTTSPATREVWRTESNFGGTGVIDLLSIDLGSTYRSDRLVGIDVIDTSVDTVGSMDPAINLLGVTVLAR